MKFSKLRMALGVVLVGLLCFAGFSGFSALRLTPTADDTYTIDSRDTSGNTTFSVTPAGVVAVASTLTVTGTLTATDVKSIPLFLGSFRIEDTGAPLTTSTTPGWEEDDNVANLVWADSETSHAVITFPVPDDYSSGGAFRVICSDSDGDASPVAVDFMVYTITDGSIVAGGTAQTAVAKAATTVTPEVVTLTPATDFASLASGDWIALEIWRDNVLLGVSDLEVKGVEFFYTATQ